MSMIPPATIEIQGDDSAFVKTIANVKALLASLKDKTISIGVDNNTLGPIATITTALKGLKKETNVPIGADAVSFESKIAIVKQQLADFAKHVNNAKVGAATAPFWADIAKLKAEMAALSPVDIKVDANIAGALAKLETLKGAYALSTVGASMPTRNYSAINQALAGWGGGKAAGGGGGGLATWLSTFFAGAFKGGFGRTTGGAGALLGLSGFSVEHLVVAGLDMGTAAAGALGGALLKGIAGAGTMGVGMLTDMAGLGQAANDIKTINTDVNNLNQAIGVYGKNSLQAQQAQAQLNYDLKDFAQIARGPVRRAVSALQNFKTVFDKLSGPAEAKGANIITKAVQTAQKFLGIIGKFASINMSIIQKQLQPFFTWLSGTGKMQGKGIFTELEKIFSAHLPTGMHALVQGLESLFKVMAIVAPSTGGFLKALNRFFTDLNKQLNNPKSHARGTINSLLADWNGFYGFLKALVSDIYNLFSHGKDQHTGLAIFQELTGFLKEFGNFEKSASGTKSITSLFRASKSEIQALLQIIPPVAAAFGQLFLAIAPMAHVGATAVVKVFVGILDAVGQIIHYASKVPALDALGKALKATLGVLAGAGGTIVGAGLMLSYLAKIPLIGKAFDLLGTAIKGVGIKGITALAGVLSKLPLVGGLFSKLQSALSGAGKASLGGAAESLTTAGTELQAAAAALKGSAATGGAGGVATAAEGAGAATAAESSAGKGLLGKLGIGSLGDMAGPLGLAFALYEGRNTPAGKKLKWYMDGGVLMQRATKNAVNTAASDIKSGKWKKATSILENELHLTSADVKQFIAKVERDSRKAGTDFGKGFEQGVKQGGKAASQQASDMGKKAVDSLRNATGSHSPSVLTRVIGQDFVMGMVDGLKANITKIIKEIQLLAQKALVELRSYMAQFRSIGQEYSQNIASGIMAGIPVILAAAQAARAAEASMMVAASPVSPAVTASAAMAAAKPVSYSPTHNVTVHVASGHHSAVSKAVTDALAQRDQQLMRMMRSGVSW